MPEKQKETKEKEPRPPVFGLPGKTEDERLAAKNAELEARKKRDAALAKTRRIVPDYGQPEMLKKEIEAVLAHKEEEHRDEEKKKIKKGK